MNEKVMVSPEIQTEAVVLPQIVSIKQASQRMGLPEYYIRRLCREVPGMAFQSGIKWYINLGKLVDYYNNYGQKCRWVRAQKDRNVKGVVRSGDSLPPLWQMLYSLACQKNKPRRN